MDIPEQIREKLDRLYSNRYLGADEIRSLESWLVKMGSEAQTEAWLTCNWELSQPIDADISFDEIRNRIKEYRNKSIQRRIKSLYEVTQKAAAILLLPLIALSVWLIMNHHSGSSIMTLATAKGEHAHLFLPDSSEVWLNVDSKLEYSTNYNAANRSLKLTGEAFFKVAKGNKYPFTVDAGRFQVKAVGTEFTILAYENEPVVSTYLKEGMVELSYFPESRKEQTLRMKPGEEATINLEEKTINVSKTGSEKFNRWTNGELYFESEPLDQVFRKVERWYDVRLIYNHNEFTNETLTVNLKKGEAIARLFEIMDQAIGIEVELTNDAYVIKRKEKR